MMNMLVMEETSTLSPRNECYAKMVSVKEKKGMVKWNRKNGGSMADGFVGRI